MAARAPAEPFTPLTMFTCTFVVKVDNIARSHRELTDILGPIVATGRGAVKALNSNFGHYCQEGYEHFLKRPKPPLQPLGACSGRLAPATIRRRKPQGDATCFNSALELKIIPSPDDDPPPSVRTVLKNSPKKYYAVKSFPSTGQTQIPGVVCPDVSDGLFVATLWAHFLTKAGVGTFSDRPVSIVSTRPIMVNFKFRLACQNDRTVLCLARVVEYLRVVKETADGLPFPIREIKNAQDCLNMSFKFVCPALGANTKTVRVNIFYRGKVNILGATDFENPREIHRYLSALFRERWGAFVGLKPLPDRALAAEKEGGGPGGSDNPPPR